MKNEKSSIQSTCAALGIFLLFLAAVIVYLAMYSKSNEKVNYVPNNKFHHSIMCKIERLRLLSHLRFARHPFGWIPSKKWT